MISSQLIADYILAKSDHLLTPMELLKLSYISHGFTLAITDKQLFSDRVEAWKYGPVIPTMYNDFSHYGGDKITELYYCGTNLNSRKQTQNRLNTFKGLISNEGIKIINRVLDVYSGFSGEELSTITHAVGTPWYQCYEVNKHGIEIPDSLTKRYYKGKL